ncbi:MAG TPA: contractile injection system protein, VgrG/Pvc8 family [Ruminiclostridium sp.]|nr:contractile injection system protein, VgrG/Pvc8 family [Ruminiclostridium sp.]
MSLKIDQKDYKIADFEKKYSGLRVPCFDVLVDGKKLYESDVLVDCVSVETSTQQADSFSFHVFNAYDCGESKFKWVDEYFTPGKSVEIQMGYDDTKETVFEGIITSVSFCFQEEDGPEVVVSGMDISYKMMKGIKSFSWENKKYSEVVSELAAGYTSDTTVDDTGITYEVVEQSRLTDYQFISWMAEKSSFEFFITGKKLFFRKQHKSKKPEIELEFGKYMLSLQIDHDIGDQIGAVTVRGWDHKKKEEFQEKIQAVEKLGSGRDGPSIIRKLVGADTTEYIYSNETSQDSAGKKAGMILNSTAMKLVSGHGEWLGIPEIMAGKYMKLSGASPNLDKLYYILSAKHTIDESGYRTSFELGGNDI